MGVEGRRGRGGGGGRAWREEGKERRRGGGDAGGGRSGNYVGLRQLVGHAVVGECCKGGGALQACEIMADDAVTSWRSGARRSQMAHAGPRLGLRLCQMERGLVTICAARGEGLASPAESEGADFPSGRWIERRGSKPRARDQLCAWRGCPARQRHLHSSPSTLRLSTTFHPSRKTAAK